MPRRIADYDCRWLSDLNLLSTAGLTPPGLGTLLFVLAVVGALSVRRRAVGSVGWLHLRVGDHVAAPGAQLHEPATDPIQPALLDRRIEASGAPATEVDR